MIRYNLHCEKDHGFEAWFSSSEDFDRQAKAGLLICPHCSSHSVSKAVMSPSVATAHKREARNDVVMMEAQVAMLEKLREMVKAIRASSDNVGDRFPEEARKIHYGEAKARGIIGNASGEEVHSLIEEGIDILPLPVLPEDAN